MDPDENLKQVLRLANSPSLADDEVEELASQVDNLDEWLRKGGFLPKRWAETCNGGLLHRAALAQQVYEKVLEAVDTFEGELGIQLGYLLGAILKDGHIDLDVNNDAEQNEVLQLLHDIFEDDNAVWQHIRLLP